MKFKVLQQELPVYPEANLDKPPTRILHGGDFAEFGDRLLPRSQQIWVEVKFPDKTRGFIPGDALVFPLKRVVTNQPATLFYKTPGRGVVLATFKKGTRLDFLDPVVHNGEVWIRVKNKAGNTGYILESTKLLQTFKPTRLTAILNIFLGGIFSILSIGLTLQLLSNSSFSWPELIARGLWAILSIYWFGIGILQLIEASEK
jgi:hypothetical protein